MIRSSLMCLTMFLITAAAPASQERVVSGGPRPEVRARIAAFINAFNTGNGDQWMAMLKEHFAPELIKRHPAEEHVKLYKDMYAEFGAISSERITREGPGAPLRMSVKGAKGVTGVITLDLESEAPFRITSIGIDVGSDPDDRSSPQVPIDGRMSPDELSRALDGYLAPLAAKDAFTGSVLVAKNGKAIFEKAYGLADRANKVPNTPGHRFSLGSINKSFTQTAIAQLASKGKLAYSDTLGKWFPDYPQELSRPATIEQLLGHSGGIADIFGDEYAKTSKDRFRSNADYFRFVSQLPPLFAPGARNQYCNGCYVTLGAIIEKASGMPYEQYLAEHVFKPAGMTHAGFPHADGIEPNIAVGYTRRSSDSQIRSAIFLRGAAGSAAGSAFATAADLLAFDNALRDRKLMDDAGTARVLRDDGKAGGGGRAMGGYGIAGGAPGTSAVLSSDGVWTVVVLSNFDPPTGESTGVAIMRALSR